MVPPERAAIDEETVIVADIDPARAADKGVTERNDIVEDRRPEMYGKLITT